MRLLACSCRTLAFFVLSPCCCSFVCSTPVAAKIGLVVSSCSLGIGNHFRDLCHADLVAFDPITGVVRWDFPGLTSWSHVDLQVIGIDFLASTQFPLLTSYVVTVDRL